MLAGVFVACGSDSEEELLGDWQRRATVEGSGLAHSASFVIGDKGYICCGTNGNQGALQLGRKEVFVFDHLATGGRGSWERLQDFPGARRQQAVGFSANGFGYMGTGWDGNETVMKDFWRYNPATDVWDSIAPLPEQARRGAIAFSLTLNENDTEYGYVGMGYTDYPDKYYLLDLWQFDPTGTTPCENGGDPLHGKWTKVQNYGGVKRSGAVAFVLNNKAYICTGDNPNAATDFWMFDPNGNTLWTKLRNMNNANPDEDYDDDYLTLARSYGVAFTAPVNGELRGHIAVGNNSFTVWEYDHVLDLWTERTSFFNYAAKQTRRGAIAFSFPKSNPNASRAFVGLGLSGTSAYQDDLWEFFPLLEDYVYED